MRLRSELIIAAAYGLTVALLAATVLVTAPPARAADAGYRHGRISCQPICPNSPAALAKLPRIKTERAATLESIQYALSNVGDGGTYVWHGGKRLSGVVQPARSFRNAQGQVCRYLFVLVSKGTITAKTEGVACRLADGRWNLEG